MEKILDLFPWAFIVGVITATLAFLRWRSETIVIQPKVLYELQDRNQKAEKEKEEERLRRLAAEEALEIMTENCEERIKKLIATHEEKMQEREEAHEERVKKLTIEYEKRLSRLRITVDDLTRRLKVVEEKENGH